MAGLRDHPEGVRDCFQSQHNPFGLSMLGNTYLFNNDDGRRVRASGPPYGETWLMPAHGSLTAGPGPLVCMADGDAFSAYILDLRRGIR